MVSTNFILLFAICLDTSPIHGCKVKNNEDRNKRTSADVSNTSTTSDPISGFRTTRSNSGNSSLAASEMNTTKVIRTTMTAQGYYLTPVLDLNSSLGASDDYKDTSKNTAIEISSDTPNVLAEECCTSIELSSNKSSFNDKYGIEGVYIKALDLKESVYIAPKNDLGSRIVMFHPKNGWLLIVSNSLVQGDFDLYKSLVSFGCNETCVEKCENNSLFQYNNKTDESNKWLTGIEIEIQCKTDDDQNDLHEVVLSAIYAFIVENEIMTVIIGSSVVAVLVGITICCVLKRKNKRKTTKLQGETYNNEHLDYDEVEPEESEKDSTQSNNDYDEAEAVNETDFIAQSTAQINLREDEKIQKNGRNRITQNFNTLQEEFYCVKHNVHRNDLKNQNSETNLERTLHKENEIVTSSENPYYDASERMNKKDSNRESYQSTGTFVRCDSDDSLHLTIPNTDAFQTVCTTENPYYGDVTVTPPDDQQAITTEMEDCQRDPVMSSEIKGGHENILRNDRNDKSINAQDGSQVSKQSQNSSKYSLSEGVILNLTAGEVQCLNDYSDS